MTDVKSALTSDTAKTLYAALLTGALHATGHFAFGDPMVFEEAGVSKAGYMAMLGGAISYQIGKRF